MGPSFAFDVLAPGPPPEVWGRLWDLARHTEVIPLTSVSGGPLAAGAIFVGRTALGPLGFDDVMVVRAWEPPRRLVVDKVGRFLRGSIEVRLEGVRTGTRVHWSQSFGAAGVPDVLAALSSPLLRLAYRRTVVKLTAA